MIGDPTELLIYLDQTTAKFQRRSKAGGWRWREGIEVFIAPESRCSFCNETFETNRVYVLDSLNKAVPKQWRLKDGSPVPQGDKMYHPHAFHRKGGVCMNETTSLPQLIFNSINTVADYMGPQYFYDVGHDPCSKVLKKKCSFCQKRVPSFSLIHRFGVRYLCSERCVQEARMTLCIRCAEDRNGFIGRPKGSFAYCKVCTDFLDLMEAVPVPDGNE